MMRSRHSGSALPSFLWFQDEEMKETRWESIDPESVKDWIPPVSPFKRCVKVWSKRINSTRSVFYMGLSFQFLLWLFVEQSNMLWNELEALSKWKMQCLEYWCGAHPQLPVWSQTLSQQMHISFSSFKRYVHTHGCKQNNSHFLERSLPPVASSRQMVRRIPDIFNRLNGMGHSFATVDPTHPTCVFFKKISSHLHLRSEPSSLVQKKKLFGSAANPTNLL